MTGQLGLDFDGQPRRRRAAALRSFHLKSHASVAEAQAGERKAQRQEERILDVFRAAVLYTRLTPTEVHTRLGCDEGWMLLTSVRRSLTNLTRAGKLQHWPADRRMGPRGARESVWSLA